ncbi:MAG TPA: HEAT repeat domain-containing protein [Polyangiaceae bacterium]
MKEIEISLGSSEPEERRLATARIVELAGEARRRCLLRALGDADWRVRKEAAATAIRLSPANDVLRTLLEALEPGENVGLRNAAVEALAGFGPEAIGALSGALSKLDADGRKLAAEALGRSRLPDALPILRSLLNDADPNVRAAGVEAVATIGDASGEQSIRILQNCLESPDRFIRLAAITGLNQLGVILPWNSIEPLTGDRILERSALLAAGRSADKKAIPLLVSALEAGRGESLNAMAALASFIHTTAPELDTLKEALGDLSEQTRTRLKALARDPDQSPDVRGSALLIHAALGTAESAEAAAEALQDIHTAPVAELAFEVLGPIGVPVLVEHVRSAEPETRAVCIGLLSRKALLEHRDAAVHAIHEALSDASTEVKRAALDALALLGGEASLGPVAAFLTDDAPAALRQSAASALGAIARRYPESARRIARAAAADGPGAHAAAVITGAVGAPVRDSLSSDVGFLSEVLTSESAVLRRAAIDALAEIGSALGMEAVAFALTDEKRVVQLAAVHALGCLRNPDGTAAGVVHLSRLAGDMNDLELAVAAIRALGRASDAQTLEMLKPLAKAGDTARAVAAVDAIAHLTDPKRTDALIDALAHPDCEVGKAAMRALAHEVDPRVHAHLGACLDHEVWDVRRLAADLLGRTGGVASLGLLRAKLSAEGEPLVREALQRAINELEVGAGVRRSPVPPQVGWRTP